MSPVSSAAESVPLMVCAAVLVTKSLSLIPLSALISTLPTVTVGAVVSTVKVNVAVGSRKYCSFTNLSTRRLRTFSPSIRSVSHVTVVSEIIGAGTSVQFKPPSMENINLSLASSAELSVALIVCAAVLVRKSLSLIPVSLLILKLLTTIGMGMLAFFSAVICSGVRVTIASALKDTISVPMATI